MKSYRIRLCAALFFSLTVFFDFSCFAVTRTTEAYKIIGRDTLRLDIFAPDTGILRPALIMIHEGGFRSGSRFCFVPHGKHFAQKGIVAVAIDYRLVQKGGQFPRALFDCLSAIGWVKRNSAAFRIDSSRIFLFGSSAGAYLATMSGLAAFLPGDLRDGIPASRLRVAGVVCNMGVYDWQASAWKGDGFLHSAQHKAASPMYYIGQDMPGFLLFAGERDHLFGYKQARTFAGLVRSKGGRAELHILPNQDHEGVCNPAGTVWLWELPRIESFIAPSRKALAPIQ